LKNYAERFPKRFFDIGIAEGHAVVMAAGMASQGAVPVFAVYSSFLQRSYDMIMHDIAISRLHVVLAVDRAGLVPGDGETHQGIYDVAYLTSIPGMTVYCPASFAELRDMLRHAVYNIKGPVAVRYPRNGEGVYRDGGVASTRILAEGSDYTICTYGEITNTALEAVDILNRDGYSIELIKLGRIYPLDFDAIRHSVNKTRRLLVLEECSSRGSIGELVGKKLLSENLTLKSFITLNVGDIFVPGGDIAELRKLCGIDAHNVCINIKRDLTEISPKLKTRITA
jgi:1-deoxy-D-xylulose-5-phosphate synthase